MKGRLKTAIAIYLLTLLVRLIGLSSVAIYADEITWMVRGKEVVYALIHRNVSYFDNAWWNKKNDTEAIGLPLVITSGVSHVFLAGDSKFSLKLLDDITASRLPLMLINSLLPVAIFWFGTYFVSTTAALLSAGLYIVNPVTIGLDRWVIHDSFLTLFSFLSLGTFLVFAKTKKISVLPGIFLALAFLTKPNGILPVAGWIIFSLLNFRSEKIGKLFWVNIAIFMVMITLLWPASWRNPGLAFFEYMLRQVNLVESGMRNFYLGEVTNDPGWSYYFFQFGARLTELTLVGVLAAIAIGWKRKIDNKDVLSAVLTYCFVFILLITLSPKKLGVRYALPMFPWIMLLSGLGHERLLEMVKGNKWLVFLLAVILVLWPLSFVPDYYQYYNSFIGGPRGAQKYDLVGFCASSRPAFEYLEEIKFDRLIYVAGCSDPVPYYYPEVSLTREFEEADLIVVETYLRNQHPEDPVWLFLKDKKPVGQFKNHGAVMTEIYLSK